MPGLGYGFTDLAKGISGMDRDIPPESFCPDHLTNLVKSHRPRRLAFTSLTAARIGLGRKVAAGRIEAASRPDLRIWALPSPSGAARRWFRVEPWQDLARDIREAS